MKTIQTYDPVVSLVPDMAPRKLSEWSEYADDLEYKHNSPDRADQINCMIAAELHKHWDAIEAPRGNLVSNLVSIFNKG